LYQPWSEGLRLAGEERAAAAAVLQIRDCLRLLHAEQEGESSFDAASELARRLPKLLPDLRRLEGGAAPTGSRYEAGGYLYAIVPLATVIDRWYRPARFTMEVIAWPKHREVTGISAFAVDPWLDDWQTRNFGMAYSGLQMVPSPGVTVPRTGYDTGNDLVGRDGERWRPLERRQSPTGK
jgi:hypothetical protein